MPREVDVNNGSLMNNKKNQRKDFFNSSILLRVRKKDGKIFVALQMYVKVFSLPHSIFRQLFQLCTQHHPKS